MSTLNPQLWHEISPYLDEALSLPEEERAAWLESFRARRPELVAIVRDLLEVQQIQSRTITAGHYGYGTYDFRTKETFSTRG